MKRWISQFSLIIFMAVVLRGAAQVYHLPQVNPQAQSAEQGVERDESVLTQEIPPLTIPDYNNEVNTPRGHYLELMNKSVVQAAPVDHLSALYPIKINNKWGFADERGKPVVQPLLSDFAGRSDLLNPDIKSLDYFKNGTQNVELNGNHMVMYIHPPEPAGLSIALHPFERKGKWGYVDDDGHVLIAPRYQRAGIFNGKLAAVILHHRLYYIDRRGKVAFGGFHVAGADLERDSFINTGALRAQSHSEERMEGAPAEK